MWPWPDVRHIFFRFLQKCFFPGDFVVFNSNLEASGGNLTLKKNSISNIVQLLEKYDLADTWRISSPFPKHYTFQNNHFSGYIQGYLDYIFVPNALQESLQQTCILPSIYSDHSPVLVLYNKSTQISLVKTFRSSLVQDEIFVLKLKEHKKRENFTSVKLW